MTNPAELPPHLKKICELSMPSILAVNEVQRNLEGKAFIGKDLNIHFPNGGETLFPNQTLRANLEIPKGYFGDIDIPNSDFHNFLRGVISRRYFSPRSRLAQVGFDIRPARWDGSGEKPTHEVDVFDNGDFVTVPIEAVNNNFAPMKIPRVLRAMRFFLPPDRLIDGDELTQLASEIGLERISGDAGIRIPNLEIGIPTSKAELDLENLPADRDSLHKLLGVNWKDGTSIPGIFQKGVKVPKLPGSLEGNFLLGRTPEIKVPDNVCFQIVSFGYDDIASDHGNSVLIDPGFSGRVVTEYFSLSEMAVPNSLILYAWRTSPL